MTTSKLLTFTLVILAISACVNVKQQKSSLPLTVEINFGNNTKHSKTIDYKEQLTALEALQYAAIVETHPVGKYVFVSSIDSVNSVPNENVWYYKINGKLAKKLAINTIVNAGDTITWIYVTDVCSHKPDTVK